jgi:hypothetical protein
MNPTMVGLFTAVSVPTVVSLIGILLNRGDVKELRADIASLRLQQHNDMIRMIELHAEHGNRLSKLEARAEG